MIDPIRNVILKINVVGSLILVICIDDLGTVNSLGSETWLRLSGWVLVGRQVGLSVPAFT